MMRQDCMIMKNLGQRNKLLTTEPKYHGHVALIGYLMLFADC